jgi:hypothetical protein
MRGPEEKTRHFIIRNKKEEIYDEPSVKRRGIRSGTAEQNERGKGLDEGDPSYARSGFFARHGQKTENSEEETDRRSMRKTQQNSGYDDYDEYTDETDGRKKAPMLVRVFAWIALLAIFFVCGYLGANYFFNWADTKGGPRVGNVLGSSSEVSQIKDEEESPASYGNVKYKLYIPEDGNFNTRDIEINKGLREDDIEEVISMYIDSLKETKMLDTSVRVLNVFQSGDWLYLDMSGAFQSSFKTIGKEKAESVITGIVRTVEENFPPIKKIKFYVDGKESKIKAPVDLTKAWEINK